MQNNSNKTKLNKIKTKIYKIRHSLIKHSASANLFFFKSTKHTKLQQFNFFFKERNSWKDSSLSSGRTEHKFGTNVTDTYLRARRMQEAQNLCPQGVCRGSRWASKQMGHSNRLSNGGSNLASYPSILCFLQNV